MSEGLYQNAVAPEQFIVDFVPGDSGLDLTLVTDVDFKVMKPDGSIATWSTVTLTNQTATTLTGTFSFHASNSEVDLSGLYIVYAVLTIPSGKLKSERMELSVHHQFQVEKP